MDFIIEDGVLVKYTGTDKDVVIPDGVTKIKDNAFFGKSLRSVTIPDGVTDIGKSAFERCSNLKSVVIPECVTEISESAFEDCISLESITIPNSVIQIGRSAFCCCRSLQSITIPDSITSIGWGAFSVCTSLRTITIPSSVTSIGDGTFSNCANLQSVTIPDNITSIGCAMFFNCKSLRSITIPSGVTSIDDAAFSSCTGLQSITIPDSITSIGRDVFKDCSSLEDFSCPPSLARNLSMILPKEAKFITLHVDDISDVDTKFCPGAAVGFAEDGRDFTDKNGRKYFQYIKSSAAKMVRFAVAHPALGDLMLREKIITPQELEAVASTQQRIKGGVLVKYTGRAKNVVIRDGVTGIGNEAFSGCSSLQSITIPESVAHIGLGAFEDCTSLQNVTILNDAVKIEGHAFWNCPRLVDQDGLAIIKGTLCFCAAEKKNMRIPDGVTHIGWDALRGCGDYQTLSMPKALLGKASRETLRGTNAGLILREEGHTSFMAYSQYSCGYGGNDGEDNLDGFVKRSKWQEYDQELINNGPIFKYRVPTRLLGMLGRLQDPVQLSGSAKEVFLEYLVKNVKKLVALAEETCCPDMITAAAQCGVINDTNVKAIQKLIDKSQVPEIAALTNLEIHSAAEERSLQEPADPLAPAYADKLKAMDANKLLKSMKLAGVKLPEVKLKDGTPAPEEVFRFILASYSNSYDEQEQGFVRKRQADAAAKLLDSRSFADAVAYMYDHYCGPLYPKTIPLVCRYGDAAQIRKLLDDAKQWNEWSVYGQSGRTAWYSLSDALALSDTREAVMWLLENANLWGFVRSHGGTIEEVCNRYVFDFGFDAHGVICFDLNTVKVEARLDNELKLALTRTDTGKIVKSLPKKDVDPAVWDEANSKLSALRKNLKKAEQLKRNQLLEAYLDKTAWKAKEWTKSYLKNVFLNRFAGLLVWSQDGNTFTVAGKDIVRSDGSTYELTDQNILVAHPMEMKQEDVLAWQKYFHLRGMKQPFDQVWEPVYDRKTVRLDRYQGCRIFYRYVQNAEEHGIHYFESFHQGTAEFAVRDCTLENQLENSLRHGISADATFKLGEFTFKKYTRRVNHIVYLFDNWTIRSRIRNDDTSVLQMLDCYIVAQITDFLNTAIESKATNLTTALLTYKQEHYPDYNAFDEFTLE